METSFTSSRLAATRRIKVETDKVPATRRRLVAKRPVEITTTTSETPITETPPAVMMFTDTTETVVSDSDAPTETLKEVTQSSVVSRRKQPTPTVVHRRLVSRNRINVARTTTTASPIVANREEIIFERKTTPTTTLRRRTTTTSRPILDVVDEEEDNVFDPSPVNRQPTTTGSVFGKTEGRTRKQQQQLLQTVRQYSFQGVDGTYTYTYTLFLA